MHSSDARGVDVLGNQGQLKRGFGFDLGPISFDYKSEGGAFRAQLRAMVAEAKFLEQLIPDAEIRNDAALRQAEIDAIVDNPERARAALELVQMPEWMIDKLLGSAP